MRVKNILLISLVVLSGSPLFSQNTLFELYRRKSDSTRIEFQNASALFKENGQSYQHVIASYTSSKYGSVSFSYKGRQILSSAFNKGVNRFLISVPAVTRSSILKISAKLNNEASKEYAVTVEPVKKWNIYLVQHTHTDIGFTHPQSEVLAEQMRYIDYALDYCDQTDHMPLDAQFRWTCESAWVTKEYILSRPASQVERLKKRIREGRIEVTGFSFNMAEIADENLMYDFLQPLKELKSAGIPVKTGMQDDVNGIAWCMPDYLKSTGIRYLSMGVNETRSILPFDKPTPFWWEAPSGERILAFRSEHYMTGNFFKIEEASPDFGQRMLWYLADLQSKKYPFDRIAIQFSGYFTDNSPPSIISSELIKKWNEKYEYPKLKLSVVSEFLEYVEKNHGAELPVYRKAWLDWWTDGFASVSRESAEIRKTQNWKQAGEGLLAMISALGTKLDPDTKSKMDHISENILFFSEHTVGADESIHRPYSENSTRQWLQKSAYAWEAVKKITLLNEEALAKMQEFLPRSDSTLIYVINSMGWPRSGAAEIFAEYSILPADKKVTIIDISNGQAVPAQMIKKRPEGAYWMLQVNDIPAMGSKAFRISIDGDKAAEKKQEDSQEESINEMLENQYYRIRIDKTRGSINSLFDKELNQELADGSQTWAMAQLIRETLPHRDSLRPSHTTVSAVQVSKGTDGAMWQSIRIAADMIGYQKGTEKKPSGIELEIRLYKTCKKIEFRYHARKEIITDPEALYVAFPISMPNARIVFETIGGILTQGQQLPGSSSDWNVAQNFVSIRGEKGQVIVISNETPLWQFSELNYGKFERFPTAGKTTLYSWVMNNYWFTNFRAFQEGAFSFSYQITSTADTTNSFATRYALGERVPLLTRTVLAGNQKKEIEPIETLVFTGSSNAVLVNARPSFREEGGILLHFREVDGLPASMNISSRMNNRPIRKMVEVNALGEEAKQITSIELKPFEVKFIEVEF